MTFLLFLWFQSQGTWPVSEPGGYDVPNSSSRGYRTVKLAEIGTVPERDRQILTMVGET